MGNLILVFLLLLSTTMQAGAIILPEDSKIKIEYISPETNELNKWLDFRVKENVYVKNSEAQSLVIPKGTIGKLQIIRLGGVNNDIVMETEGYINLTENKQIELCHYKDKRKKARKVAKVARYASVLNPIGAAVTVGSMGVRRATNKFNLPDKLFTVDAVEI